MYEALRKGASVAGSSASPTSRAWFIEQMKELVELEQEVLHHKGSPLPEPLLRRAKQDGFADRYRPCCSGQGVGDSGSGADPFGIVEAWDAVPVSGVDNAAYYYSTYNGADKVPVSSKRKVMILGGGPNRIGQGIEFDYCCVHAASPLRDLGLPRRSWPNCNPETVSTDYEHLRQALLRATDGGGRPQHLREGEAGGRHPRVRRADAAEHRGGAQKAGVRGSWAPASRRSSSPRTAIYFRKAMQRLGIPMPEAGMAIEPEQGARDRQSHRLPADRAAGRSCWAGRGMAGRPRPARGLLGLRGQGRAR